jgi:hypothetical protein
MWRGDAARKIDYLQFLWRMDALSGRRTAESCNLYGQQGSLGTTKKEIAISRACSPPKTTNHLHHHTTSSTTHPHSQVISTSLIYHGISKPRPSIITLAI